MSGFCVLGCGTMGKALLTGIFDSIKEQDQQVSKNVSVPNRFYACVKFAQEARDIEKLFGETVGISVTAEENVQKAKASDVLLLSCKPQGAEEVLSAPGMKEALKGKLILSILAGKTIDSLKTLLDDSTRIIRIMPNTASRIRESMSVLCPAPNATEADVEFAEWVFNGIGRTMKLPEKLIDAATAMCGSGPAFVATMIEAMTDGGVMMGIPFAQAQELAAQTMVGTGQMVLQGQHPAKIRNDVSTPAGCTISGLLALEDGKIRSTIARGIEQATKTASGLGK